MTIEYCRVTGCGRAASYMWRHASEKYWFTCRKHHKKHLEMQAMAQPDSAWAKAKSIILPVYFLYDD
jgi:hypothetical protein